jgi:hypothetical protein
VKRKLTKNSLLLPIFFFATVTCLPSRSVAKNTIHSDIQTDGKVSLCTPMVFGFYSVGVTPDVISLQLCTPKVGGVQFKLYRVHNLHLI